MSASVALTLPQPEVYRSRKDVTICFEDDIYSATPTLPDFEISVNALLA